MLMRVPSRLWPMHPLAAALLLLAAPLTGCLASELDTAEPDRAFEKCAHPYPCGDGVEWPLDLVGPFALDELLHLPIASFDGTVLDGYVYLPDVPPGVKVPVVVWSHAYFEGNYPAADDPIYWEDAREWGAGLSARTLVEHGYAVAYYSVRGTGSSAGCFDMFGPDEQADQAFLVEALAAQPWSNGRVGMMGLSYHGTTPWEAAINTPPSLKTIVVAGMVSDLYTFFHTPQGAAFTAGYTFQALVNGIVTGPSLLGQPPAERTVASILYAPERACPEMAESVSGLAVGSHSDVRAETYWNERRLIDRFPDITTAVLLTHGFQDQWGSGHQSQENAAWAALSRAPKWQVEGQWQHEFPHEEGVAAHARLPAFGEDILAWLDYWLKGIAEAPPTLGTVDYQDASGTWRTTTSWPPAEARDQVLHLTEGTLAPNPTEGDLVFRARPDPPGSERAWEGTGATIGPLCAHGAPGPGLEPHGALAVSEPVAERTVIAGNPFAYLTLTSDQPGGLVTVALLDLAPDWGCEDRVPHGVHPWAVGAADLRFHQGNFQGRDLPVDTPTPVRVDIVNIAEVLEPGHRLGVFLSYGDQQQRSSQPYTPLLRIHAGESHVVLPVVEGDLGGGPPTIDHPPRPFVPVQP